MRYGDSRPDSKKSKIKEIKEKEKLVEVISNIDMINKTPMHKQRLEDMGERAINKIISLEEDIQSGNYTLKPFKRRRNMDLDKLKELIMEDILIRSKSDNWIDKRISKEHYARKLEVKEHLVEQVFHLLNKEGILSQRESNYAHDTNRNWLFSGEKSGWAEDTYNILI